MSEEVEAEGEGKASTELLNLFPQEDATGKKGNEEYLKEKNEEKVTPLSANAISYDLSTVQLFCAVISKCFNELHSSQNSAFLFISLLYSSFALRCLVN